MLLFILGTASLYYILQIEVEEYFNMPLTLNIRRHQLWYERDERNLSLHPLCPKDGGFDFYEVSFL